MAPPFKTVAKNHKILSDNLSQAWKSKSLPARQWRLVESQLVDFEKGLPCQEFLIFLKAIDVFATHWLTLLDRCSKSAVRADITVMF